MFGLYLIQTVVGIYLIIVGLVMIIFRKQLRQMTDEWFEKLPFVRSSWAPSGTFLLALIVVFGGLAILIGIAQLLLSVQP